ncbi:sodium channel protein Nach [Bactrocera tryoni]|uniref:sodium channel protein Nach n=1 Tax=Bactrocera tryoni TaxID=59916 RepID=UPI001A9597B5|nr:sodium channel protein Nach [Bactrocera tryoni]
MNCATFVKRNVTETGIHGLPYLMRKDLHWTERLFWLGIIIAATYYSIFLSLEQWKHFQENPLVFAAELTWDKKNFLYPGITMCSDFRNALMAEEIIMELWQLTPNDTRYDYYSNFLQVLNVLQYDTLETLLPYKNDSTLWGIDYIDILTKLQTPDKSEVQISEKKSIIFAPAITEVGLCRTTSQLNKYTNPSGEIKSLEVSPVQYCLFMSICFTKLFPEYSDEAEVFVYLHNPLDVVAPNDITNVYQTAPQGRVLTVDLEITAFSAEAQVRRIPIEYRKCRYPDESNLKYFETYSTALCCMEHRIHRAMKLCNCKPHFYAVAAELPTCTIDQLLCLQRHNWTQTNCTFCLQLCEYMFYVQLQQSIEQPMHGLQLEGVMGQKFERTVNIQLNLPYRGIRRRVVFSFDEVVVSFGGAFGLFLGASFISTYTIIKIFGDFLVLNCLQFCRQQLRRRRRFRVRVI